MAAPKLKMLPDGTGAETVKEGDEDVVILVYGDGIEKPLLHNQLISDVKRVSDERESMRSERDKIEKELKKVESRLQNGSSLDDWLASVDQALETVSALDEGQLATAEKVEHMKAEVGRGWEKKMEAEKVAFKDLKAQMDQSVQALQAKVRSMLLSNAFLNSNFIETKLPNVPPDMAEAMFGHHFQPNDRDVLIAKDSKGNIIRSRVNPSEEADFEEAIAQIVDAYPHKERILGGTQASGSGAPSGSTSSVNGSSRTITRSEYDKLPAQRQNELIINEGFDVVDG